MTKNISGSLKITIAPTPAIKFLFQKLNIPVEITLIILEYAKIYNVVEYETSNQSIFDFKYFSVPPLPYLSKMYRIVIKATSNKAQENLKIKTWTWIEICLLKPNDTLRMQVYCTNMNSFLPYYQAVLDESCPLVNSATKADGMTFWVRSMCFGKVQQLSIAKIQIYYH